MTDWFRGPRRRPTVHGAEQTLVVVAALCTVAISLWLLGSSPAQGYEELSEAYSVVFWILIATGLGAAGVVCLLSSLRGDGYWKLALSLACVIYLLYNTPALFRGWAMYGRGDADVLSHLGQAAAVTANGQFDASNFYPGFTVLLAEFSFFGFEDRALSPLFSGLFSVVYLLGTYLLARELSGRRRVAQVTLFVALIPLYSKFQHSFHPAIFSFMALPTFLYVVERYWTTANRTYLAAAIVLSLVLVVSHPVTALLAVGMIAVAIVARFLYQRVGSVSVSFARPTLVLGVLAACWLVWYGRFAWVRRTVQVAVGLAEGPDATVASTYGAQQLALARGPGQIVAGFLTNYGPFVLVCLVGALGAAVALRAVGRGQPTQAGLWLSLQYAAGVAFAVVTIGVTYVVAFHPIRNARLAIFLAVLLSGFYLSRRLHVSDRDWWSVQGVVTVSLVVLLLAALPVAVTNTHFDWQHMTYAEKDGTDWFYEHGSPNVTAVSHSVERDTRSYLRGGFHEESGFEGFGGDSPIPRHFGYRTNETVGEATGGEPAYLVTKEYDQAFYEALKEFRQADNVVYTDADRRRLARDPTVDHLYDNGGYSVWFVHGR